MKWFGVLVLVFTLIVAAGFYWQSLQTPSAPATYVAAPEVEVVDGAVQPEAAPRVEVIAENLSIPWEVIFLPDGELLVTERPGTVLLLKQGVEIPISGVRHLGEGGLLGAALHPDFASNNFVYLYQTTESDDRLINRIDRYILNGTELVFGRTVVDNLPGARFHDGGRIAFGPDGHLYVTLGDAGDEPAAQSTTNLAGSVLRYTAEGEIPADNPFANAVYSYGHRNPQGLAWDSEGQLWSTEHGRSGVRSGFDELNLIERNTNYGWPDSEGDFVAAGTKGPRRHSGAHTTWAPGGLAYLDGSFYIPGLRGATLYEAVVEDAQVVDWHEHFVGEYGRLRTVNVGPDGLLYVTTSNRDGRGVPATTDDRILRINPMLLDR